MIIDRSVLKNSAKAIIKAAKPSVIVAGLIFIAVSLVLGTLENAVLGVNITPDDIQQYTKYYLNGNLDAIVRMSERMAPPSSAYLISLLISAVTTIFSAGFVIFLLNTVKNTGAVYGNLLDGFGMALRLIGLALLEWLFISLWSLLLVIPGIIAAYRYRMAQYLLIEHPEMSVMDCIRASKQMMAGHKWECFVLDLSFIGWWLLSAIPYVGYAVMVWTTPYMETTYALYYMALAGTPVVVNSAPNQSGTM